MYKLDIELLILFYMLNFLYYELLGENSSSAPEEATMHSPKSKLGVNNNF